MGKWTEAEVDTLRENYRGHGSEWDGWDELLPGRSPAAIRNRAQGMGLTRQPTGRWSADQDAYLLMQLQVIARRTGHSERQVVARAVRLARSAGVVLDA